MKIIYLGMILFLITSVTSPASAGMYKCTDKIGKISYQATPCTNSKKETQLKNQGNKISKLSHCKSTCRSNETICISKLENGSWNADGGLEVCKEEKKVCDIGCIDPNKAKRLKISSKYKRSIYEIDVKYKKKAEDRSLKKQAKEEKKCRDAKAAHKKALEDWDGFGNQQKKRLSRTEKNHYLDKIDDTERTLKYDCSK